MRIAQRALTRPTSTGIRGSRRRVLDLPPPSSFIFGRFLFGSGGFFLYCRPPRFFSEVVVGPGGFSFSFTSAMESPIRLDLWPSIEAAAFDSVPTEFLPGFPSWGVSKCVRFSPGEGFFSSFFRSPIDSSLLALFSILVARLIRLVNELECQSPIRHDLWPAIESPPAPSAAKLRPGHPCASLRDREAHHEGPSTCLRPRPFSFFFSSPHRPDFRPPPFFAIPPVLGCLLVNKNFFRRINFKKIVLQFPNERGSHGIWNFNGKVTFFSTAQYNFISILFPFTIITLCSAIPKQQKKTVFETKNKVPARVLNRIRVITMKTNSILIFYEATLDQCYSRPS